MGLNLHNDTLKCHRSSDQDYTPSISSISNFIIYRRTIYEESTNFH